jgi:hypothetical protein
MHRVMGRDAGIGERILAPITSDIASVRDFGLVASCHLGRHSADLAAAKGLSFLPVELMMSAIPPILISWVPFVELLFVVPARRTCKRILGARNREGRDTDLTDLQPHVTTQTPPSTNRGPSHHPAAIYNTTTTSAATMLC